MDRYVDEIMEAVNKRVVFHSIRQGREHFVLNKEFDLKSVVQQQIRKAQLDVLEEVGYRQGALLRPDWISERLIDKINQLKQEQTNDEQ